MPGTIDKYDEAEEFVSKHEDVDLSLLFSEEIRLLEEKDWMRIKRDILNEIYYGVNGRKCPYIEDITPDQWKHCCAITNSLYPEQMKIYPDNLSELYGYEGELYWVCRGKGSLLNRIMGIPPERRSEICIKAKSFFGKEPIPYVLLRKGASVLLPRMDIIDYITQIPPEQWDELIEAVSPLFTEYMEGSIKTQMLLIMQINVSSKRLKEVCNFISALFTEEMDGIDRENILRAAVNFNKDPNWKIQCSWIRKYEKIGRGLAPVAEIKAHISVATAIGEIIDKFRKEDK